MSWVIDSEPQTLKRTFAFCTKVTNIETLQKIKEYATKIQKYRVYNL